MVLISFENIYIYAPEGCQHGTHTNETAYPLGTYAYTSQSDTTTLLAGSTWPTLTLYSGLLFQVRGGYLCIFQCIFQYYTIQ